MRIINVSKNSLRWYKRVCIAVAALTLLWTLNWIHERHTSLASLDSAIGDGLKVEWLPVSEKGATSHSGFGRYMPWVGPSECYVQYEMKSATQVASALRHFGSISKLSIDQSSPEVIQALLDQMGTQKQLRALLIFNVELDESICEAMNNWPNLEDLSLVPSGVTGEGIPYLLRLKVADLSYSPVSDLGLKQLSNCTSLEMLRLCKSKVTLSGIEAFVRTAHTHIKTVSVSDAEINPDTANELIEKLKQSFPDIKVLIR